MKPDRNNAANGGPSFRARSLVVIGVLVAIGCGLVARAVELQVLDRQFLTDQGDRRFMRVARMPAHRGTITDRFGEPLAVSSPVDSVWVNPQEIAKSPDDIKGLARALNRDPQWLAQRVTSNLDREFLYVARHMEPAAAARIKALGLAGTHLQREYRRYYPSGEVTGHVLGFTSVEGRLFLAVPPACREARHRADPERAEDERRHGTREREQRVEHGASPTSITSAASRRTSRRGRAAGYLTQR